MTTLIQASTVNEAYPRMLKSIMEHGQLVPSRVSNTRELHPAVIDIEDVSQRLVTAYDRPVNVAFALAEVLWILAGQRDVATLKFYNGQIANYSDDGVYFNAAYGHRLRHAHGHDQVYDAIKTLQNDAGSRQVILNLNLPSADRGWRPQSTHNGGVRDFIEVKHNTKDRACNVMCLLKIREGRLDWMQIVRSNDAVWGTPYNWMQFLHLQAYIAAALRIEPGKYTHVVDSLHVYDYHYEEARRVRPFDLYAHTGGQHLGFSHEDTTEEALAAVLAQETAIRQGAAWDTLPAAPGGGYWGYVLEVLSAHALYKQGEDGAAAQQLLSGEEIYGPAQLRFYYHHRWYKDEFRDLVNDLKGMLPGSVFDWITSSHA